MTEDTIFSPEDKENFKNAFDAFDENRDDLVSTDVLGKLLRAIGFNPMPEEVEDMIEDIGASTFDFNSFMYIVYRHAREADPEGELIDAFRVFDKEGTGKYQKIVYDYPSLNGYLDTLKTMLKEYYKTHITEKMFKYELIK